MSGPASRASRRLALALIVLGAGAMTAGARAADTRPDPQSTATAGATGTATPMAARHYRVHGYLGVRPVNMNKQVAPVFGAPNNCGALVWRTLIGSPAEQAGIKAGDVITRVDDRPVNNARQLRWELTRYQPGETANVTLLRQGQTQTVPVRLGETPYRQMGWHGQRPMMRRAYVWRGAHRPEYRQAARSRLEWRLHRLEMREARLRKALDRTR